MSPKPIRYRFTYDTLPTELVEEGSTEWRAPTSLIQNALRVCEAVTPTIESSVAECCERLDVTRDHVTVYVVSSRDFQAVCVNPRARDAVIVISSVAVSILSSSELCYVVGHEIGHWLLRHTVISIDEQLPIDLARKQRYAEVSADRIGIVACGDVNSAARVMLKALSGLTDEHIRFDISSVLKSVGTDQPVLQSALSTHPIMLTRIRAALWFSIWLRNEENSNRSSRADLLGIDRRIKREIDAAIGTEQVSKANECFRNAEMWLDLLGVVKDGRLDLNEQQFLAAKYGQSDLEKMKVFLSGASVQGVIELVRRKLVSELGSLSHLDDGLFRLWMKEHAERSKASGVRL